MSTQSLPFWSLASAELFRLRPHQSQDRFSPACRFRITLTSPCRRAKVQLVVAPEGPPSLPAMVALLCEIA